MITPTSEKKEQPPITIPTMEPSSGDRFPSVKNSTTQYYPDAVLEDILLRLPPPTLVRLTSVCKSWHSLINSHTFKSSHLGPTTHQSQFVDNLKSQCCHVSLSNSATPSHSTTTTILNSAPSCFFFVDSLHGLICLSKSNQNRTIVLWNPSIRRLLVVPTLTDLHLAVGFGFDYNNHDFKVIRFLRSNRVELYSLNEDAWRVIDATFLQQLGVARFAPSRCFLKGNVHWIVECAQHKYNILIFNVEDEKFSALEFPPELANVPHSKLGIAVIEGCISLLDFSITRYINNLYYVWLMREYGVTDSWTKSCTIDIQVGINVLVLRPRERGLVYLHPYDDKCHETMNLGIQGKGIKACEYRESLFLLDK